jgi:transposase-like protein
MDPFDRIYAQRAELTIDKLAERYYTNPDAFPQYAMQIGLLHSKPSCPHCFAARLDVADSPGSKDGCCFECPSCTKTKSLRFDSVCSGSPLSLFQWMLAAICYDADLTMAQTERVLSVGINAIERIFGCFDQAVLDYMAREPLLLGGPGEVVEIDEMYRSSVRKYKKGQLRPFHFMGEWVMGLTERRTGNVVCFVVASRDAATLGPMIREYVRGGSILMSDEWAAYNEQSEFYDHRTCNHSTGLYSYVDTDGLKVHINTMEGFWGLCKVALRTRHGVQTDPVALQKFMDIRCWRLRHDSIFMVMERNLRSLG